MKFSQFGNKVAYGLGFSSLHEMDLKGADMDLCWGNGFDNERVMQLFNEIVFSGTVNRDADQLVYFFCLTEEGSKSLIRLAKTFDGSEQLANSLIRGLGCRLVGTTIDTIEPAKIDKFLGTLERLVEGENIPFVSFEKPDYISDIRFWELITPSDLDISSILNCLSSENLSAARYYLEARTQPFVDASTMEEWSYPGYVNTRMEMTERNALFNFLASHIGERKAFLKIVDPNTYGESVSPFIKQLAQSKSLDHWKQVFLVQDCVQFFSTTSDRVIPTFVQDLLASSISSNKCDIEQLSTLKKSALTRLVSRGCVSDKTAMLLAGKNSRLKGKILEDSLGM